MSQFLIGILVILAFFLFYALRILREYERGVVFFLGRYQAVKGPGLIVLIPGIQQMVTVDMRTIVMDVPTQDVKRPLSKWKTSKWPPANSPKPHYVPY